jgi:hypothetical protein
VKQAVEYILAQPDGKSAHVHYLVTEQLTFNQRTELLRAEDS